MKYPVKVEKKEHLPFALSYMPARLRAMRIITSSHTFIADENAAIIYMFCLERTFP